MDVSICTKTIKLPILKSVQFNYSDSLSQNKATVLAVLVNTIQSPPHQKGTDGGLTPSGIYIPTFMEIYPCVSGNCVKTEQPNEQEKEAGD